MEEMFAIYIKLKRVSIYRMVLGKVSFKMSVSNGIENKMVVAINDAYEYLRNFKSDDCDLPPGMIDNNEWMRQVKFFRDNDIPWSWEDITINKHGLPDFLK